MHLNQKAHQSVKLCINTKVTSILMVPGTRNILVTKINKICYNSVNNFEGTMGGQ